MKNCGILTISIDVELAWGFCDKIIQTRIRNAIQRERDIVRRLLTLFAQYDIRATWAVVGHLLATQCDWSNGQVHPEIERPLTDKNERDWFFQHPRNHDDPLWYGRDMVEWIRTACPTQEIGSHSFCHLPYCEKSTRRNAVKADISRARALHNAHGLPFEVFIFPRNIVGYRDILAEAGVRVYRGHAPGRDAGVSFRPLRRLLNFFSFFTTKAPATVSATVDDVGMVNVPDSMLLSSRHGLRKFIPSRQLVAMGRAGLDRAVDRGEIFHLWFHPSNFADKMDNQLSILEDILRYAQELRSGNQLKVLTLGDIQRFIHQPNLPPGHPVQHNARMKDV